MKKTGKLTFCATMAALASAFMISSLFPYLTYAIAAVAGLFIMVAVIETGEKWAFATYLISAALVLILPADYESKLLFVMFFGYYPIVKALLEKCKNRVVEYIAKFAVFNGAIILSYGVIVRLLSIDTGDMGEFGKYTYLILLVAANIVFPIYDLAVSRVASFYCARIHKTVSGVFNKH